MDAQAKQQIVERIKQATNVLVTVSSNPSVDGLAACIGLTLLLNKMEKHGTAVFSGKVPSTLEFLQPEKTIETNTDSLQDFIISLDKNKADKLRYKVEDQVVRVFITPYKSSLSEKDLVFSQGDFNVDVVVALGIKDRSQIDQAIAAHGRILHDATVISINAGAGDAPQLGQINWQEPTASSLCEMLVSISEAFGTGLIDNQMATAFLTGIVAETHRFSNNRTSPKVMTMAAQLMAAGANQQLIVSKLEPPPPPPPKLYNPADTPAHAAGAPKPLAMKAQAPPPPKKVDTITIQHNKIDLNAPVEAEFTPNEIHIDKQGNLLTAEGASLAAQKTEPEASSVVPIPPPKPLNDASSISSHALLNPADYQATKDPPFAADMQNEDWVDPFNKPATDVLGNEPTSDKELFQHVKPAPTVAEPQNPAPAAAPPQAPAPVQGVDNARNAVESALASAPFDPSFGQPVEALNAQPLGGELHGSQTLPAATVAPSGTPAQVDAPAATPSLSLPTGTNVTLSATVPPPPPANDMAPPAPPPVPPPLPLKANPGAMLPSSPATFQPPAPSA